MTNEPVLMVNIERVWLIEDIHQCIFVIIFSCGKQPLICDCVVSRCVNEPGMSSIHNILLDAPSVLIFRAAETIEG